MSKVLFAFLIIMSCSKLAAQMERVNSEVSVSQEPIAVMEKGIVGWVKLIDGKWRGAEHTILDGFNLNYNKLKKHQEIGQDNFVAMHVYDMLVDGDRLWIYIKFFRNGSYRYEQRQKGWEDRLDAYYYVVDPRQLPDLNKLKNDKAYTFYIPTKSTGHLRDVRLKKINEKIINRLRIPLKSNRSMLFYLRVNKQSNVAQFQIASIHEVFTGTAGIVRDNFKKGISLYGSEILFEHLYYETSFLNLLNIMPLKRHKSKVQND